MADFKISDLTALTTVSDTDLFVVSEDAGGGSYNSKSITAENIGIQMFTWSWSAARDANATNIYLWKEDGLPTNESPFIVPFDCTLIGISAATDVSETWTAEVHNGNSLVTGAVLSITAATSGYTSGLDIDFSAGDDIELYCNGSTISKPSITVFFRRRG